MTKDKDDSEYFQHGEHIDSLPTQPPLTENPLPPSDAPDDALNHIDRLLKPKTLTDHVEELHITLVQMSAEYRTLLEAVSDVQAVEGSLMADDIMAALMIRNLAMDGGIDEVSREPLAVIRTALKVVLRRYGASRNQRRRSS
jgi:hypothetical protein